MGVALPRGFWLFFNTGPSNTILANVTHPSIRASGFALNILVIHALGDAISPPAVGAISDHLRAGGYSDLESMNVAFLFLGAVMAAGGVVWLWGSRYLAADTAAVEGAAKAEP